MKKNRIFFTSIIFITLTISCVNKRYDAEKVILSLYKEEFNYYTLLWKDSIGNNRFNTSLIIDRPIELWCDIKSVRTKKLITSYHGASMNKNYLNFKTEEDSIELLFFKALNPFSSNVKITDNHQKKQIILKEYKPIRVNLNKLMNKEIPFYLLPSDSTPKRN